MRSDRTSQNDGLDKKTGYVPPPRTGIITNLALFWQCQSDVTSTRVVAVSPRWNWAIPLIGTIVGFGVYILVVRAVLLSGFVWLLVWAQGSSVVDLPRLKRSVRRESIVRFEWVWVKYRSRSWIEPQAVLCIRSETDEFEWITLEPRTSGGLKSAIKKFAATIDVPFVRVDSVSDGT